jgi:hypothetical protein
MILKRFGPAAVAAVALLMVLWSWRSWPDPLIDFGQQLYVSWRLAEGAVLYRDVAYMYGPLSPYLNALFFRIFGVGLMTMAVCNLAILGGVFLLLWRIFVTIGSRLSATIAGIVFAAVFAFGQLVEYGNYNFVCPYVYNLTHGVALSLLAIYGLVLYHGNPRLHVIGGIGFVTGLLFTTKAEVFLAGGVAVTCGIALTLLCRRLPAMKHLAAFCGCAFVPPLLCFILLSLRMPAWDAIFGMLGTWRPILEGEVARLPFYRWSLGLEEPGHSLLLLRKSIVWYGLLLAPAALLGLILRKEGRYRIWISIAAFCAVGGFLAWWRVWWPATTSLLPVAMLALVLPLAAGLMRRRHFDVETSRRIVALTMVLFGLLLLAKILLFSRTSHYGFALAMPATLLGIAALLDWLPASIERAGGCGGPLRAATLAVCGAFVLGHLVTTHQYHELKSEVVASGRDAFRADWRGGRVNEMLRTIDGQTDPNSTLAAVPAGAMLNYLSRRVNPTPYIYFMPSDLLIYGEERMLERFRSTPPDFIALVHKDSSEFGARFFGKDYGRALHSWIQENYRVVGQVGERPLQDDRFGMALMRLREISDPAPSPESDPG